MKKFICTLFTLLAIPAFAAVAQIITVQEKSVPVYAEANSDTKPVTTLTKGQKIISIYQQNDWVKIANPDNGNVGWVKKSDWKSASNNIVTIEQVGNGYSITSQSSDGSMNNTITAIHRGGR